ncbi:MAG: winged helix-turn-helix domain-containing protein [Acidobacteriota bacterium]|nr:winged helix-turn-helix domain-containing protein [Acidobacteriota bacterium]MDQ5838146.1 winged helix-turn-helix domain-containing protein [Acidobacteriota bacterium]
MGKHVPYIFEFGSYVLNPPERLLLREGTPVEVPPRVFDLLLALVSRGGHLLEKEELLRTVWQDSFVEEGNVNRQISTLRRILGDGSESGRYIETVPKRGYRFVAPVHQRLPEEARDGASLPAGRTSSVAASSSPSEAETFAAPATSSPASRPARRAIAVLPFKVAGVPEEDGEYLGVGLADALVTRLCHLRELVVRPTSAVARYCSPDEDILEAGRELRVSAVLDGRVQRAGERLRVTVQLVGVEEGATLWAEKFDERWTDIFTVQDSISEQVARALTVKLTREEREGLTKHGTESLEAFQLYLRGRSRWNRFAESELRRAVEFFQLAIEIDPSYALAHCGVADCYNFVGIYGVLPPSLAFSKAKAAAERALQIDPALAEAYTPLGFADFYYDWEWAGAESKFRRAIQLNPGYVTAHHHFSFMLSALGRYEEALSEVRRALEVDPLSPLINIALGFCHWNGRRYEQAEAQCLRTIARDPDFFMARYGLAMTYAHTGRHDEGINEARAAARVSNESPLALATLGHAYAVAGLHTEAAETLERLKGFARRRYVPPYFMATVCVGMGRGREALEFLERGFEGRDGWLTWLGVEPRFDPLRADPHFQDLLRRIGLPQAKHE